MKFLKQQNLSKFSIRDQVLFANQYGRAVMDLTGGLRLPQGTTAERPQLSGVRIPGGVNGPNGFIRYNTDIDPVTQDQIGLEVYINGSWEIIRAPGSAAITKQTLGPGDYVETVFGPLSRIPASADNILVFVENVFQISVTNFNILYNYQGSGDAYLEFAEPVPLDKNITIYFGFAN
jgi:hypothetical protein